MKNVLLALSMLGLVLLPLAGCSSDSDGDGGGGVLTASFSGTSSPGANTVSLQPASANGPSFTVDVVATELSDLYGLEYTLTYSPAILNFIGASEGNHMSTGGVPTQFAVALENGTEGRVVVGHARLGDVTGVSGTGTLHSVSFRAVAAGTTGVSFESIRVVDSNGAVIPGVLALGGTANVSEQ